MKLSLRTTFSTSCHSFSLFEEDKYIFPLGRFFCVKEFQEGACSYIPIGDNVESITALTALTTRKSILTVEKQKDSHYYFSVYSIKGDRKSLKLNTQPSAIQIAPCPGDPNFVHCLIFFHEGIEVKLIDLTKMRIIAQAFIAEPINEIQVSPNERGVISACGKGILKLYTIREEGYEQTDDLCKKLEGKNFIAHIWLDSVVMLACTPSEIFHFKSNELIKTIPNPMKSPIRSISKFNKFFLICSENQVCAFSWSNDVFKLAERSNIKGTIVKMDVNQQEDRIVLKLEDFSFLISSVDELQHQEDHNAAVLKWKPQVSIGAVGADSLSICEAKSLALFVIKEQEAICIWNIDTNRCILKKQFSKPEDTLNSGIVAGDFHPTGYSMALAFGDRIRLYHLTVEDITLFKQIPSRRVRMLKYSHGGHLLAYVSGKGKNCILGIINTFTNNEVMTTKLSSEIEFMCWSPSDEQLAVAGENNAYIWRGGVNFKEREEVHMESKINQICFDFRSSRLIISISNAVFEVQSVTKSNKIPLSIPNFHYLISNQNKYIATDTVGNIYVYQDLSLENPERQRISSGKATLINCEASILYLADNNNELSLLKGREEMVKKHEDFTLINRSEIIKNREKLRSLEQLIDNYQAELQSRLEGDKAVLKQIKDEEERNFKRETLKMQQQFSELTAEKLHIEKVSNHLFKNVEEKQMMAVESLEGLYEQKLARERRKIMDLEQKVLEQNVNTQVALSKQKAEHSQEVQQIHHYYETKATEGMTEAKAKQKEDQIRKQYEIRLQEMEVENEELLENIQNRTDSKVSDLFSEVNLMKKKYNMSQVDSETMRLQVGSLKEELEGNNSNLHAAESKIVECKSKITSLEKEVLWKDELIKEKENKLFEYEYKIADLEKSKHVLSFRTTEIWKELEPKEDQVSRLKKQLFKLESEFNDAVKENYLANQKVIKAEKLGDHMKKEISDIKHKLKLKAAEHEELALQIHKLVNDVEPRARGTEILKVYQQYVKFKKPQTEHKSENEATDELNRHLVHLEQSLFQVNQSNDKYLQGREEEMTRKMKENAELISDLNDLRKKQKEFKTDIITKDTELARLRRQLTDLTQKASKKTFSERTGFTVPGFSNRKRNIRSSQVPIRPVESMEASFRMDKNDFSTMRTRQTRIFSATRTSAMRGDSSYHTSHIEKTHISELAQELEIATRRINQQDRMIDELNRRLMAEEE